MLIYNKSIIEIDRSRGNIGILTTPVVRFIWKIYFFQYLNKPENLYFYNFIENITTTLIFVTIYENLTGQFGLSS